MTKKTMRGILPGLAWLLMVCTATAPAQAGETVVCPRFSPIFPIFPIF